MSDGLQDYVRTMNKSQEQLGEALDKVFSAAQPKAVFSDPIVSGDYTVITTSEILAGGGVGFGAGYGTAPRQSAGGQAESEAASSGSGGGGNGGGGFSTGRPVAALVISPDGVKVEPIADVTKIALAFFTALGAMAMMLIRMRNTQFGDGDGCG